VTFVVVAYFLDAGDLRVATLRLRRFARFRR
jgi:hypothetical protein